MASNKKKSIKTTNVTIIATTTTAAKANMIDSTSNRILWTPIKITAKNITMIQEQQTTTTTILSINKQIYIYTSIANCETRVCSFRSENISQVDYVF